MANEEHLNILNRGVATWNQWRKENPRVTPDLSSADLRFTDFNAADLHSANLRFADLNAADLRSANLYAADLRSADLSAADLRFAKLHAADLRSANLIFSNLHAADLSAASLSAANLISADLSATNLSSTDLSATDFSNANLCDANLKAGQALNTNFANATLTGACIEDWNINAQTNLQGVECHYIYLKSDSDNGGLADRRPNDPHKIFAAGEFLALVQKSLETVDLIFANGIDWKAFFSSYQELNAQYADYDLAIQAIEQKGESFIIRLEVDAEANKGAIEFQAKELYETKLRLVETWGQIQVYESMMDIVRTLALRPMISAVNHNFYDAVGQLAANNYSDQRAVQRNYATEQQSLAKAAAEIQRLLQQLEQNNPAATLDQKKVFVNLGVPSTLKQRAIAALNSVGQTVLKEFLDAPYANTGMAIAQEWLEGD
jgi:uncharacterized protein YjbI with pentapeptide repeats